MYDQYAATVSPDALAQLGELARQQAALEHEIDQCEQALGQKQKALGLLSEKTIPELMDTLGVTDFTTRDGVRIVVNEIVRASIPKQCNDQAVAWLDEHGYENLVKRKFTILFGREDQAWANRFAADLRKRKHPLDAKQEAGVHAQTLSAFVREQLEAGNELPLDLLGVFRQRVSKVELR